MERVAAVDELVDAGENILEIHTWRHASCPASRHRWPPLDVERLSPWPTTGIARRHPAETRHETVSGAGRAVRQQRLHLACESCISLACRIRNERPVAAATVAV